MTDTKALAHVSGGGSMQLAREWTADELKQAIAQEKEMREAMVLYYRDAMKANHHYYQLPGQKKPALSKEGALNLCSLLKVVPIIQDVTRETDGDHLTVYTTIRLESQKSGATLGVGEGVCSTKEQKYAYRTVWPNEIPDGIDHKSLRSKRFRGKGGAWHTKYFLPNDMLADAWNTVVKMSWKRAVVAAALMLPLASELFTQDIEEGIDAEHDFPVEDSEPAPAPAPAPARSAPAATQSKPTPAPSPAKNLQAAAQYNAQTDTMKKLVDEAKREIWGNDDATATAQMAKFVEAVGGPGARWAQLNPESRMRVLEALDRLLLDARRKTVFVEKPDPEDPPPPPSAPPVEEGVPF